MPQSDSLSPSDSEVGGKGIGNLDRRTDAVAEPVAEVVGQNNIECIGRSSTVVQRIGKLKPYVSELVSCRMTQRKNERASARDAVAESIDPELRWNGIVPSAIRKGSESAEIIVVTVSP